jgi:hypothetical protein
VLGGEAQSEGTVHQMPSEVQKPSFTETWKPQGLEHLRPYFIPVAADGRSQVHV